jgi:uncharacterized protein YbjT (DUF2867 family)
MKIVVIGGSGLIGSKLVALLRERGHEVVAASLDSGVNTITREGLAEALEGADVVVDVANSPSFEDEAVMRFFLTSTSNLLAAEKAAGVKHHVALSIIGAHRVTDSGYLRAKAAQEDLIRASTVPFTIVESAQFFEFIERIANDATQDGVVHLPHARLQPIAADEVVAELAEVALGPPLHDVIEIAGPEAIPLDDLAREVLRARADDREVVADDQARYFNAQLDDRSLTPGPGAHLGKLKLGEWLERR